MAFGFGGFPDMSQRAMQTMDTGPSRAAQVASSAYRLPGSGGFAPPSAMPAPSAQPQPSQQAAPSQAPPATGAPPGMGAAPGIGADAPVDAAASAAGLDDILKSIFIFGA